MSGCYIQLHTIFRPLLLLHPGTYSHVLLLIVCDVLFLLKKKMQAVQEVALACEAYPAIYET